MGKKRERQLEGQRKKHKYIDREREIGTGR
jgi:hypothetical protein